MKREKQFANKTSKRKKHLEEIERLEALYDTIDATTVKTFDNLPLSSLTLEGLKASGFVEPTEIQRESIGLALKGMDVLGAAITGSGKTLAFIIPILESLWRKKWSQLDGLGALIVSPTRELALQTYEVLCKVGCKHDLSAALIIGGTDVQFQKERISRSNIIVCTPGRILQHMDENPTFSCDNLQVLVLDEADRILDMGFREQINAVLQNLPTDRQTLLFSATQTKSVKDLARLSLKDPVYVSVHEHATYSTPARLRQTYMICEEHEKIDLLWSFLRNHLHSRIIIFFTNCKQVRFVYEAFRRLRPGLTVLALHGSMNQMKRVNVYEEFCNKQHAALFATDVAARGLDFPDVDWVYQFDCPQDATEYIHRSGRTARYSKEGEALLILTPSQEKGMLDELSAKKVPIQKINVNRKKLLSIHKKLEILCARDPNFKLYAQRAFVTYLRSIVTMSNKSIFDVKNIDGDKLAQSYGLISAPRVRFLRKMNVNVCENSSSIGKIGDNNAPGRPFSLPNEDDNDDEIESSTIDDFLTVKKTTSTDSKTDNVDTIKQDNEPAQEIIPSETNPPGDDLSTSKRAKRLTKSKLVSKLLKKKVCINHKIVFDEEDNNSTSQDNANQQQDQKASTSKAVSSEVLHYDIEEAKRRMEEADKIDRQNYRQKIKAKHTEKRLARKAKRKSGANNNEESEEDYSSQDEERSVDLSWVPDFDKINASKEKSENEETTVSESPDTSNKSKKKPTNKNKLSKKEAKRETNNARFDEEFALALLDD